MKHRLMNLLAVAFSDQVSAKISAQTGGAMPVQHFLPRVKTINFV
jgi:hypothetical protein